MENKKDPAEAAAEEFVMKEVAVNDGSYWGWSSYDIALAKSVWMAAIHWCRENEVRDAFEAGKDGTLLYECDEPGAEGCMAISLKYSTFED